MGAEDFADFFTEQVTIEPLASRDAYGKPTYGAGVAYRCRISAGLRQMVDTEGIQRTTSATIYLSGTPTIGPTDRVTLPAGHDPQQPPVLAVDRFTDEVGAHHTRITCGRFTGWQRNQ